MKTACPYIAAFCSTTETIHINQILLTLAKSHHLIFYCSKKFLCSIILSPHGKTTGTALTANWIPWPHHSSVHVASWEISQSGSELNRPLGPCLNAAASSYLCPGGYHYHWSSSLSSAHPKINSAHISFIRRNQLTQRNSITVFKTPKQRQWYQPSLQLAFKSLLSSAINITLSDRVRKLKNSWWWHLQINPVALSHGIVSSPFGKGSFLTLYVVALCKRCDTFPIQIYK